MEEDAPTPHRQRERSEQEHQALETQRAILRSSPSFGAILSFFHSFSRNLNCGSFTPAELESALICEDHVEDDPAATLWADIMWSLTFEKKSKYKGASMKSQKAENIDGWRPLFMDLIRTAVDPPPVVPTGKEATAGGGANSTPAKASSSAAAASSTSSAISAAAPPSPTLLRLSSAASRRAAVANAAQHKETFDTSSLVNSLHPTHTIFSRLSSLFVDGVHPFNLDPAAGPIVTVANLPLLDRLLVLEWLMEYKLNDQPETFMPDIRRGEESVAHAGGHGTRHTHQDDDDEERAALAAKWRTLPLGVDQLGHSYYQFGDECECWIFRERSGDEPKWSLDQEYGFLDDQDEPDSALESETSDEEMSEEDTKPSKRKNQPRKKAPASSAKQTSKKRRREPSDEESAASSEDSEEDSSEEEDSKPATPVRQSRNSMRAAASSTPEPTPLPPASVAKAKRPPTAASTNSHTPAKSKAKSVSTPSPSVVSHSTAPPVSVSMDAFLTPKAIAMQQRAMEQLERLKGFHAAQRAEEEARKRAEEESDEDDEDESEEEEAPAPKGKRAPPKKTPAKPAAEDEEMKEATVEVKAEVKVKSEEAKTNSSPVKAEPASDEKEDATMKDEPLPIVKSEPAVTVKPTVCPAFPASDLEPCALGYRLVRPPQRFAWEVVATSAASLRTFADETLPSEVKGAGKITAAHKDLIAALQAILGVAAASEEARARNLERRLRAAYQPKKRSSRIELLAQKREQEEAEAEEKRAEEEAEEREREAERREERTQDKALYRQEMEERLERLEKQLAEMQEEHQLLEAKEQEAELAVTANIAMTPEATQVIAAAVPMPALPMPMQAPMPVEVAVFSPPPPSPMATAMAVVPVAPTEDAIMADAATLPSPFAPMPPPFMPALAAATPVATMLAPYGGPIPMGEQALGIEVVASLPVSFATAVQAEAPPSLSRPSSLVGAPSTLTIADTALHGKRLRLMRIDRVSRQIIWRRNQLARRMARDAKYVGTGAGAGPNGADRTDDEAPVYSDSSDEEKALSRVTKELAKEKRRLARAADSAAAVVASEEHDDTDEHDEEDDEEVEVTGWDEPAIHHRCRQFLVDFEAAAAKREQRKRDGLPTDEDEDEEEPAKEAEKSTEATPVDAEMTAPSTPTPDASPSESPQGSAVTSESPPTRGVRTLRARSPLGRLFLRNSLQRGIEEPGLFFRIRRKKWAQIQESVTRMKARERALRVQERRKRREERRARGEPSESESEEEAPPPPPATPQKPVMARFASAITSSPGMKPQASPGLRKAQSVPRSPAHGSTPAPASSRKLAAAAAQALLTPEERAEQEAQAVALRRQKARESRVRRKAVKIAAHQAALAEAKERNGGVTPPPDHPLYVKPLPAPRVGATHDDHSSAADEHHEEQPPTEAEIAAAARYAQALEVYASDMVKYQALLATAICIDPITGNKLNPPLGMDGNPIKKPRKPSKPVKRQPHAPAAATGQPQMLHSGEATPPKPRAKKQRTLATVASPASAGQEYMHAMLPPNMGLGAPAGGPPMDDFNAYRLMQQQHQAAGHMADPHAPADQQQMQYLLQQQARLRAQQAQAQQLHMQQQQRLHSLGQQQQQQQEDPHAQWAQQQSYSSHNGNPAARTFDPQQQSQHQQQQSSMPFMAGGLPGSSLHSSGNSSHYGMAQASGAPQGSHPHHANPSGPIGAASSMDMAAFLAQQQQQQQRSLSHQQQLHQRQASFGTSGLPSGLYSFPPPPPLAGESPTGGAPGNLSPSAMAALMAQQHAHYPPPPPQQPSEMTIEDLLRQQQSSSKHQQVQYLAQQQQQLQAQMRHQQQQQQQQAQHAQHQQQRQQEQQQHAHAQQHLQLLQQQHQLHQLQQQLHAQAQLQSAGGTPAFARAPSDTSTHSAADATMLPLAAYQNQQQLQQQSQAHQLPLPQPQPQHQQPLQQLQQPQQVVVASLAPAQAQLPTPPPPTTPFGGADPAMLPPPPPSGASTAHPAEA